MTPEQLIKKLHQQREFRVELGGGKAVTVRRPAEMELGGLLVRGADGAVTGLTAGLADVRRHVVGWEGFVEADLTPAGAADAVPFDAALWGALVEDRRDWVGKIAQAIVDAVLAHEKAVADTRGN